MSKNHQNNISRRSVMRVGAIAGLGAATASKVTAQTESGTFRSPRLTPFIQPLPRQTPAQVMTLDPAFPSFDPYNRRVTEQDADRASRPVGSLWHQLGTDPNGNPFPSTYYQEPNLRVYEVSIRDFRHVWHPELTTLPGANPEGALMFGYGLKGQRATYPGPLFFSRYGKPTLIRVHNDLPPTLPDGSARAFGLNEISLHLHNFHTASESDGNPLDPVFHGEYRDHLYNLFPAGHDPAEIQNTLWYHDHCLDYTAQNVYRGLVGFHILFDDRDSGNETDSNPNAFRLPSGEFDVPMVITDPAFLPNGELFYDLFNLDGILGDHYAVNGAIKPFFDVKARKYRFRFLDGGPARWYHLAFTDGTKIIPINVIANDGNLLAAPVTMNGVNVSVAERFDVVFDFKDYRGKKLYLINRMEQKDGRGPTGKLLSVANSPKLLEFRVGNTSVADPSQLPATLRPQPSIKLSEVVRRRKFKFDRTNGAWAVNGSFFNGNVISAAPKRGTAEIWELEGSGGWSHPVHVHFEEGRILTRNGKTPPPHERGRKDVYPLLGSEKLEVFIRFRDYVGKYVTHCHNTVHEDHAMMFRWDITDSQA
jgi:FtsP/CotA-like multicopper oxidase with cupredoxin domain